MRIGALRFGADDFPFVARTYDRDGFVERYARLVRLILVAATTTVIVRLGVGIGRAVAAVSRGGLAGKHPDQAAQRHEESGDSGHARHYSSGARARTITHFATGVTETRTAISSPGRSRVRVT